MTRSLQHNPVNERKLQTMPYTRYVPLSATIVDYWTMDSRTTWLHACRCVAAGRPAGGYHFGDRQGMTHGERAGLSRLFRCHTGFARAHSIDLHAPHSRPYNGRGATVARHAWDSSTRFRLQGSPPGSARAKRSRDGAALAWCKMSGAKAADKKSL
jgi:hypothetical protein